jgi:hypothetical protein
VRTSDHYFVGTLFPNQYLTRSLRGVLDTKLCDKKVCQSLATGLWFSPVLRVSSTNKTDRYDITEILLKVALNTISVSFIGGGNPEYRGKPQTCRK